MSTLTVTADRDLSSTTTITVHPESVAQRVRRALVMSGMVALIIGAVLGVMQADPSILVSRFGYEPHPLAVTLLGAVVIGLVGGLIAGLALRGKTSLLRWMVGMFALIVGLIVSEMVHGLVMGMSLDVALRATADDVEAAQIGVGAVTSLIGSLAGWRAARRSLPVSMGTSTAPAAPPARSRGTSQPRSRTIGSRTRTTSSSRPRTARRRSRPQVEIAVSPAPAKSAVRPKRRRLARRRVHLGRQATNVCPYCLEEVLPNDPRGRVVCDICGTPHHGDCWAITGKCEVPHLQT